MDVIIIGRFELEKKEGCVIHPSFKKPIKW